MLRLMRHAACSLMRPPTRTLHCAAKRMALTHAPPLPSFPRHALRALSSKPSTHELLSVVKVFASRVEPNYGLPWQSCAQEDIIGSGTVIEGRRILTNAHIIAHHTMVSIQKHGSPTKYNAQVVHEAHGCDLAVLTVEDEEFWKDVPSLTIGDIPDLHSEITVVGYPIGGEEICVTAGIVSRIDMQHYSHSGAYLLAIQIDAAINPGNSGGPALKNGKIAGIVFQKSQNADSSGHIIPASLIHHVLTDISRNGKVIGFPSMEVQCQSLEDNYTRKYFGVPPHKTGILVRMVGPTSAAAGIIHADDVLTDIDGISISNDGMIPFRGRERINFIYHIQMKHVGDSLRIGYIHRGKEMTATVDVSLVESLVPVHSYDIKPRYFIYCGFVFLPLVQPYLHDLTRILSDNPPRILMSAALDQCKEKPEDEVVFLSQVLGDEANKGKGRGCALKVVKKVNGTPIHNLDNFVDIIDRVTEGPILIEFHDDWRIVLDSSLAKISEKRVLSKHRIPTARALEK